MQMADADALKKFFFYCERPVNSLSIKKGYRVSTECPSVIKMIELRQLPGVKEQNINGCHGLMVWKAGL